MSWVFSLIAGLLLVACSSGPHVAQHAGEFSGGGSNPVYVANHGWHTGIVLPAPAIQGRVPELKERFSEAAYLEFGWGDKEFYQAEEMTVRLAMRAIFWPTDTVVRVLALPHNLSDYVSGAGLVKLCLTSAELLSLSEFIAASFARTADGGIQPLDTAAIHNSQFYAGSGKYHMMNTCNTWTARGLESAGMRLSVSLKLTAGSVMSYLHEHPQVRTIKRIDQARDILLADFTCP